jgi:hypothetical protein
VISEKAPRIIITLEKVKDEGAVDHPRQTTIFHTTAAAALRRVLPNFCQAEETAALAYDNTKPRMYLCTKTVDNF